MLLPCKTLLKISKRHNYRNFFVKQLTKPISKTEEASCEVDPSEKYVHYLDRDDVKKAIHAENIKYQMCSSVNKIQSVYLMWRNKYL